MVFWWWVRVSVDVCVVLARVGFLLFVRTVEEISVLTSDEANPLEEHNMSLDTASRQFGHENRSYYYVRT